LAAWQWKARRVNRDLETIAGLIGERNSIDEKIASITGRPMTAGHLGEWIAAEVFGIELEKSASAAALDGRFRSGPLSGRTVNVKWYLKREGLLDVTQSPELDFHLVLAGPTSAAVSSRGGTRPWCIAAVYLFDARQLLVELRTRGVAIGAATSVRSAQWASAEIYPQSRNGTLALNWEQRRSLELFAPA
jgi:hypothetical protein